MRNDRRIRRPARPRLWSAVCVLALAGTGWCGTVAEALRDLNDQSPAVRAASARRLARARSVNERSRAVVALVPRLDDPDAIVRREVVGALAALGDRRVAPAVATRLAKETDPGAIPALLFSLGTLGAPGDEPRVLPFVNSPYPEVRVAALGALGDLGGPAARATLLSALASPGLPDPTWMIRSSAVLALSKRGRPEDVPAILRAYREGDGARHWFARSVVARAIAGLSPDPVPTLRDFLADEDARVVVTAAEGMARRAGEPAVLSLLQDERATVRAAAATAIGRLRMTSAYDRLRLLARFDPSREVRWAGALALFRAGDPVGDDLVLQALGSDDPGLWSEALALLTDRTGAEHGRDVAVWRQELRRWRAGR